MLLITLPTLWRSLSPVSNSQGCYNYATHYFTKLTHVFCDIIRGAAICYSVDYIRYGGPSDLIHGAAIYVSHYITYKIDVILTWLMVFLMLLITLPTLWRSHWPDSRGWNYVTSYFDMFTNYRSIISVAKFVSLICNLFLTQWLNVVVDLSLHV